MVKSSKLSAYESSSKISLKCLPIIALLYATSATAYMDDFFWPSLYVGADAQVRHIPFEKDFGGNVLPKDYPQGNFYIGLKGNDYIGMEVGYEMSKTRTHSIFLPTNSILFGVKLPFNVRQNVVVRFKGLHASLVGFFPVFEDCNLRLLASIGITNQKIRVESIFTEINNGPPLGISGSRAVQSSYVLRLMTGLQYMFTDYFGIRGNIRWENTAKLKNIAPIRLQSPCTVKAKDSIILGLGVVVQF